jgi:rubrerythrin
MNVRVTGHRAMDVQKAIAALREVEKYGNEEYSDSWHGESDSEVIENYRWAVDRALEALTAEPTDVWHDAKQLRAEIAAMYARVQYGRAKDVLDMARAIVSDEEISAAIAQYHEDTAEHDHEDGSEIYHACPFPNCGKVMNENEYTCPLCGMCEEHCQHEDD